MAVSASMSQSPVITHAKLPYTIRIAIDELLSSNELYVTGFKTVPTYGFYRLGDPYGAVTNTPKVINKIKEIGNAYIKQYPALPNNGNGHVNMPNIVLEDTNIGNGYSTIIDWVLDQRRTD